MTSALEHLQLTRPPVGKAEMLIRKPVAEVFAAFIDPAITSKFWFTKGSGKLVPGAQVRWDWEMFNVSSTVFVEEVAEDKLIRVAWGEGEARTSVEWTFTPRGDNATFVSIVNSDFSGDGDELVSQAIGSTEGFTIVLAGCKAWLEHGIALNLVADRFPEGFEQS
jgi:uncharacterized protein YndB with AHSA1/START domain